MEISALWIFILAAIGIPCGIFLLYAVHLMMDGICMRHAQSFCRKNHLEVSRIRLQPAFDKSGVKTEFNLVQIDCRDAQKQRRLIVLVVWPFGVRKVLSNEEYPDSYDEKWPQPANVSPLPHP